MTHMHIARGRKALIIILSISLIGVLLQVIGGWITGSLSVLSDGWHTFFDNIGNLFRFAALCLPIIAVYLTKKNKNNHLAESSQEKQVKWLDTEKAIEYSKRFNSCMLPLMGLYFLIIGFNRGLYPQSFQADLSIWLAVGGLTCNLLQMGVFWFFEVKESMKDVFAHLLSDSLHSCFAILVMWLNIISEHHRNMDGFLTMILGVIMIRMGWNLLEEMTPSSIQNRFPDKRVVSLAGWVLAFPKRKQHDCHQDHTKDPKLHSHGESCSDGT